MKNYKKATMFGLCRMLRKQSGGLFLMSSQSVDSQETRVEHQSKRAAMFGLDARIALAIFGALSVISGAALYSAIQNAKVTQTLANLNEVAKAYDAYYLDVGEELDLIHTNLYLEIRELITSSKSGWKGPYLPYTSSTIEPYYTKQPNFYAIEEVRDGAWSGTVTSAWADANCVTGSVGGACAVWSVKWFPAGNKKLIEAMDEKVDGEVDGASGNLRFFVTGTDSASDANTRYVFLKHRISFRY